MDKKTMLLLGICLLISILLVFNVRISMMMDNFKVSCANNYTVSDNCHCVKTNISTSLLSLTGNNTVNWFGMINKS